MAWTELRRIIDEYRNSDGPFGLATLVKTSGSTYRHVGARMLITCEGRYFGRLSAGCVEEEIAELAQGVIRTGKPLIWSCDLRSRFACDGAIHVLVESLEKPNAFVEALSRMVDDRKPLLVKTNYRLTDPDPGTRLAESWETDNPDAFIEQIQPPIRLILFGDYADAEAVAQIAKFLGWQVEFAMDAALLLSGDARTACVVMSHHLGRDTVAVRNALQGGFGYVGLLGPRRRKNLLLREMISEGYVLDTISTLHSPAGLDIGSESPEEIALAVVAEIQAALMGRKGGRLRERREPIHKAEGPLLCNELRS
ncbi:MAG TPA: XdhC family protein [Chthoniobacterales bacterium]|nr:XdhC family protein [Chthoniobacterales bacterium]